MGAAFASAITSYGIRGDKTVSRGTYTSSGTATGGDIETGLNVVTALWLQPTGAAVSASAPVVDETFPVVGTSPTIVTVSNEVGIWEAEGYL